MQNSMTKNLDNTNPEVLEVDIKKSLQAWTLDFNNDFLATKFGPMHLT